MLSGSAACFETRDAAQIVSVLSRILAPHQMERRQPERAINARVRHVSIGSLVLTDLSYGAAVRILSRVPRDRILIHAVLDGESQITSAGGDAIRLQPGHVHASLPGAPLKLDFSRESRHLTANIPAWLWTVPRVAAEFRKERAAAWLHMMQFLLGWWDADRSGPADAAGAVEAMITAFLRDGEAGESIDTASLPWFVAAARRRIAERVRAATPAIGVAQVAADVGVAPRTLQSGFSRFLNRSFGEEVRQVRLTALDLLLREARAPADVTASMQACGIVSMGRFAGYYRDRFGMLPSARLRGRF